MKNRIVLIIVFFAGIFNCDYAQKLKSQYHKKGVGFVDEKGEWVIKPKFYSVHPFEDKGYDNKYTVVKIETGKPNEFGVAQTETKIIDKTGHIVLDTYRADLLSSDRYVNGGVSLKEGLRDFIFDLQNGNYVILPGDIEYFGEKAWNEAVSYFKFKDEKSKKNGILRKSDLKIILEPEYEILDITNPKAVIIRKDGVCGITDTSWKKPFDLKYQEIVMAKYPYMIVKQNGLYGLMDVQGNKIIDCKYEKLKVTGDDAILGEIAGKIIPMNFQGVVGKELKYERRIDSKNNVGLFPALKSGVWGYINASEEWIIQPQFEQAFPFLRSGKAMVQLRDSHKFTQINSKGEKVGKYLFDQYSTNGYVNNYKHDQYMMSDTSDNNLKIVEINGLFGLGYLNKDSLVLPAEYGVIFIDKDGYRLKNGSLWGMMNTSFKIEIPFSYSFISELDVNNVRMVTYGSKKAIMDRKGKLLTGYYEFITYQFGKTYSASNGDKNYTVTLE